MSEWMTASVESRDWSATSSPVSAWPKPMASRAKRVKKTALSRIMRKVTICRDGSQRASLIERETRRT